MWYVCQVVRAGLRIGNSNRVFVISLENVNMHTQPSIRHYSYILITSFLVTSGSSYG